MKYKEKGHLKKKMLRQMNADTVAQHMYLSKNVSYRIF